MTHRIRNARRTTAAVPPASPFSAIELDAHLLRVRWVGVECLAIGAAIVSLPFVVFVVPSLVTPPDFLRPDLALPGGSRLWVLLFAVPMLWVFAKGVQRIISETDLVRAGGERIRVTVDPACRASLKHAARTSNRVTAMAATEALAKIDGAR